MLDNTNMGGGDGRSKYSHILQDVMLASSVLYFVGGLKAALRLVFTIDGVAVGVVIRNVELMI